MPQPTRSAVHVNRALTNISIAYIQNAMNFIAGRVFPIVPVEKQSDVYFTYTKNDWFRDEAQQRAPGDPSAGSGFNIGTDNYNAKVWAFHKDIAEQIRANADAAINLDRDAAEFVMQRLLLRREIQWATNYFAASVWGTDVDGVASGPSTGEFIHWSAYSTSDPITDVETGKAAILGSTGFEPNTLVLGYDVFKSLRNHPDIVDRYKYTSSESITAEMMAQVFGVDRILVAKAVKATNIEGETPAAYSFVQGKHALLCYSNPTPSLLSPSAGYTFAWNGLAPQMGRGDVRVKTFRMEELDSDRVEGEMAFDQKVVSTDLGYFFNGAVA